MFVKTEPTTDASASSTSTPLARLASWFSDDTVRVSHLPSVPWPRPTVSLSLGRPLS